MARINYYEFPNGIDAHTRYLNGALSLGGDCRLAIDDCRNCKECPEGWSECKYFHCHEAGNIIGGITVTEAKRLLKEFGGIAWTDHIERDGGHFETTEITLKGNNSKFKYNRHL